MICVCLVHLILLVQEEVEMARALLGEQRLIAMVEALHTR
jgi:hypothetical protein